MSTAVRNTFLVLMQLGFAAHTFAQTADSITVQEASRAAQQLYTTSIGGNAHLYNGVEYKYPQHALDIGHPYFLSAVLEEGSIAYDGQVYPSVEMLYNLVTGVIVIDHAFSQQKMQLITGKIKSFTLQGHRFVRLANGPASVDFYDVPYDGSIKLFAVRKKGSYADFRQNQAIRMYRVEDEFYIYKDAKYFPVKNRSSLFKILESHKSEIRKYLDQHKITFRKNPERALIESVKFYDHIQKTP